ncbi:MAG: hypothetical protein COZ69_15540 [Deltaproteobacteria bacterium CG_4_8_14_3_um_filter_45_9]|nr:MAG: hypothetical protein COZ69_15540 [Deltaproteobacteria bacterium CG_4_8_14_3_um_filter_45_9]
MGKGQRPPNGLVPQLWAQLGRCSLPSETLKSGLLEGGSSTGCAKGFALKVSALLLIPERRRFKFSLERPPRP